MRSRVRSSRGAGDFREDGPARQRWQRRGIDPSTNFHVVAALDNCVRTLSRDIYREKSLRDRRPVLARYPSTVQKSSIRDHLDFHVPGVSFRVQASSHPKSSRDSHCTKSGREDVEEGRRQPQGLHDSKSCNISTTDKRYYYPSKGRSVLHRAGKRRGTWSGWAPGGTKLRLRGRVR